MASHQGTLINIASSEEDKNNEAAAQKKASADSADTSGKFGFWINRVAEFFIKGGKKS